MMIAPALPRMTISSRLMRLMVSCHRSAQMASCVSICVLTSVTVGLAILTRH